MNIPRELEGLEHAADAITAPQAAAKRTRKAKAPPAPPKPPPTPEELAASAAVVEAIRIACANREATRDFEREASRLASHTGQPRPGGQVYWSSSGRMLCGKCHRYCGPEAAHEAAACVGHWDPWTPPMSQRPQRPA